MPSVAASEQGAAQTAPVAQPAGDAGAGLDGTWGADGRLLARSLCSSRTVLERPARGGESPVGDGAESGVPRVREYRRPRDSWWEAGSTTTQG